MNDTVSLPTIDSTYDVVICYRSNEYGGLGEAFEKRLSEAPYALRVFRDATGFTHGTDWMAQLRAVLHTASDRRFPGIGPTLVVLATPPGEKEQKVQADPNEPDVMCVEIDLSLPPYDSDSGVSEIPIIVVPFGASGLEFLNEQVERRHSRKANLAERHRWREPFPESWALNPEEIDEGDRWSKICGPIVGTVRRYFGLKLREQQKVALEWATRILGQRLSGDAINRKIENQRDRTNVAKAIRDLVGTRDRLAAVVVYGPGGVGKSALVAQCLREAIEEHPSTFFPIIMPDVTAVGMQEHLRQVLGVHWLGSDDSLSLDDEGLHRFHGQICFITDSLEHADDVRKTGMAIERLRGQGKLIATTRADAWMEVQALTSIPETSAYRLGDLDEDYVAELFGRSRLSAKNDFLRRLVFTDIAFFLNEDSRNISEWRHQSDLLHALFKHVIDPGPGESCPEPVRERRRELLRKLANQQLKYKRFDVDEDHVLDASRHIKAEFEWLKDNKSIAVVEGVGPKKRLRLRHDVVDSYNIATVVRGDAAEGGLLRRALELLSCGFGQVIGEGIVQAASDFEEVPTITGYFNEFLRLVENKKEPDLQAAGWNAQSVVTAKLRIFVQPIREILSGRLEKRPPNLSKGEAVTCLKSGRITQETLSSVASLLSAAALASIEDPDGTLLSSLLKHIKEADWRGRLIEALTRIKEHADAFSSFIELCKDKELMADHVLVRYLSKVAVEFYELAPSRYEAVMNELGRFAATEFGRPRPTLLRAIDNAMIEIEFHKKGPMSRAPMAFTIEEIEEGLSLFDLDRPNDYSDWKEVEAYLDCAASFFYGCDESSGKRVLLALGCTLWHFQARCHQRAIRKLAALDHPFARGLLLHLLTFEDADVTETALIEALTCQGEHLRDRPETRRRFRAAYVRACAARAELGNDQRAEDLSELAEKLGCDQDAIITTGFVGFRIASNARVEFVESPPPCQPEWLGPEERLVEVGPELERKFVFVSCDKQAIVTAPSTWTAPRRLHKAMLHRTDFFNRVASHLKEPFKMRPVESSKKKSDPCWQARFKKDLDAHIEGIMHTYANFEGLTDAVLPGIAVLHALVCTKDGCIVEGQRSFRSEYMPGAWAITFEEQFKGEDFETDDPVMTCFRRGLQEEFGVPTDVNRDSVTALAFGVEWDIQNTCLAIAVVVPLTLKEFKSYALKELTDEEITTVRFSEKHMFLHSITRSPIGFVRGPHCDEARHPTSVARLALIAPI